NMSSRKSNVYVHKKSKDGQDILCPIDKFDSSHSIVEENPEDCVEQDVVGRYAGNIEIRSDNTDSR
ncbi:MAG: hypothetical protein ACYTBV_21120, partial [Planctomycetota bacterium]